LAVAHPTAWQSQSIRAEEHGRCRGDSRKGDCEIRQIGIGGADTLNDILAKQAAPNSRLAQLRNFYYDTATSTNIVQMQALKLPELDGIGSGIGDNSQYRLPL
jgi:hypothetical protein